MMRLAYNNIKSVTEYVQNGITFHWHVFMTSERIRDSRCFINYEDGISVVAQYDKDRLPKCVKKFIDSHDRKFHRDVYGVNEYIYE